MLGQSVTGLANDPPIHLCIYVCLVLLSHHVTYDNRNEYVRLTLPYLANATSHFTLNRVRCDSSTQVDCYHPWKSFRAHEHFDSAVAVPFPRSCIGPHMLHLDCIKIPSSLRETVDGARHRCGLQEDPPPL